ncbi:MULTISPECIES: hypothetical protein [Cysteiniphilum]|uniref:secretion/conjugation apparatus DotM-related subunit n=1 Tax=Cysteiniphilum TaxID=2056696 RepID=UPI00177CD8EA|nr:MULTISPECIES: hypothetical protein [Cysteiniphilum]
MANNTPNADDTGMASFYVVTIILLLLLFLYWLFHDWIVYVVFLIKQVELMFIMLWDHSYVMLMNWSNHVLESQVTLKQLKYLSYNTSEALYPLFLSSGVVMIGLIFFYHPSRRYRTGFSMKSLSLFIAKRFKKVFLLSEESSDVQNKLFETGLSPINYLKHCQLIKNHQLDLNLLQKKLIEQLGEVWHINTQLSIEVYGLFTAFALCVCDQRQASNELLERLTGYFSADGSVNKKLSRKRLYIDIDKYFPQCLDHPKIKQIITEHHFTSTLLCELLAQARRGGILASSGFLWLKKVNRTLWYVLNNVGRKTFFVEGAAVIVHWQAERSLKKPIATPMLQKLIMALQQEYQLYKTVERNEK